MKKIILFIVTLLTTFSICLEAFAQSNSDKSIDQTDIPEAIVVNKNLTRADYGVQCVACGEYDYMKYLWTEQIGIGGTMYVMYYYCENCGGLTTVVLNAKSIDTVISQESCFSF